MFIVNWWKKKTRMKLIPGKLYYVTSSSLGFWQGKRTKYPTIYFVKNRKDVLFFVEMTELKEESEWREWCGDDGYYKQDGSSVNFHCYKFLNKEGQIIEFVIKAKDDRSGMEDYFFKEANIIIKEDDYGYYGSGNKTYRPGKL